MAEPLPEALARAVAAAVDSVSDRADRHLWLTAAEGTIGGHFTRVQLVGRALTAAMPAITAAERERIAKRVDGYDCPCNEDVARFIREDSP